MSLRKEVRNAGICSPGFRVKEIDIYSGQIKRIGVYYQECTETQGKKQNIQKIFSATLFLLSNLQPCSFLLLRLIFASWLVLPFGFASYLPLILDATATDPAQPQLHLLLNVSLSCSATGAC